MSGLIYHCIGPTTQNWHFSLVDRSERGGVCMGGGRRVGEGEGENRLRFLCAPSHGRDVNFTERAAATGALHAHLFFKLLGRRFFEIKDRVYLFFCARVDRIIYQVVLAGDSHAYRLWFVWVLVKPLGMNWTVRSAKLRNRWRERKNDDEHFRT